MGNISSVENAFHFIGEEAMIIHTPEEFIGITHLVIPGVGAFSEAMANIKQKGFAELIQQKARESMPILGICLGMQILASVGEEGGITPGLDIIPGRVVRFAFAEPRVPHVGWDTVTVTRENPILKDTQDYYFVHSYHFVADDQNSVIATCDYGITFTTAVQKDNILGVQFHPEKSFQAGLEVLRRFAAL